MTTTLASVEADKKAFAQIFNRLAKGKRARDIDVSDLQIYYNVLSPYPIWATEAAADELLRTSTFGFPSTDAWLQEVQAQIQRRLRQTLAGGREWNDECPTCRDTGWRDHLCNAQSRCGRRSCARSDATYEHPYHSACSCREHNRTYQRNTRASQLGHGSGDR
jgi:hypothetical protein